MVCVILLSKVYKPGIEQGKPGKEAKQRIGWKIPVPWQHEVKTSLLGFGNVQSRMDGAEMILSQHSCIPFWRNPKLLVAEYFPPGILLCVSSVKSRALKNPTAPTAPMRELVRHRETHWQKNSRDADSRDADSNTS